MKKDENIVELEKFVEEQTKKQEEQGTTVDNIEDRIKESLDDLSKIMGKAFEAKRKVWSKGYLTGLAIGCGGTIAGFAIAAYLDSKKKK